MCGFVALYAPGRAPIDPALLDRATDRLAHRGPDGRGTFSAPGVGLGHRRLAIIDVEGGRQPLLGADPRVAIAFNGEVYNHREARAALDGPWRTDHSDTEVFLRAYETRGVEGFSNLVGMWGAAIWDGRSEELVVVRDRLGVKPVYHAALPGGRHAFSSEIRALLELPDLDVTIDPIALEQLLTFRYVPAPRTLLRGVRKVAPGEVVTVGANGLRAARYWHPRPQPDPIPDEQAIETFLEVFDQASRAHLVSDVPVGLFLSGGIDSAALLQGMGPGVHCFTAAFEGDPDNDETAHAAETCRRFGGHHHVTVVRARDYVEDFDAHVRQIEEPVLNDSALATAALARLAKPHVKVVLSGQGADEPLAGYDRFKGEALAPWIQRFLGARTAGTWAQRLRLPPKYERAARALGEPDPLQRALQIYAVLPEDEKASLLLPEVRTPDEVDAPLRALHDEVAHLSALGRMMYCDTRVWLPDELLLVADKLSMAHGLELRVPFLDHRLVEWLESVPDEQKLRLSARGFETKVVHRRAMNRRLPGEVLRRPKLGFDNPMSAWLRGPLRPMLESRVLDAGSPLLDWVAPSALHRLVHDHTSGVRDLGRALYLLMALDAWMRAIADRAL